MDVRVRQRAFYVAGVTQLRMVGQVHKAITKALEQGTTLADFKAEVGAKLESEWGGEKPGRLETIFRTNVQMAYNAGRLTELDDPVTRRLRPFRGFSVVKDSRTTEFICLPLAPVVLPADDPFIKKTNPPLHFRCRTGVMSFTAEQAEAMGLTSRAPKVTPDEGFGGDPREPRPVDLSDEPEQLRRTFAHKLENQD